MKEIKWKKLNLFEKIVFCFGWLGVFNLIFWISLLIDNNLTQEEKFWNSKSYRIVYIFGWINSILIIMGFLLGLGLIILQTQESNLNNELIRSNFSLKNISPPENQDNFSNIAELHWGHLPITYKFENESSARQMNLTRTAFKKIEDETSNILKFEEVTENPDISIYFKKQLYDKSGQYHVAEALISKKDSSRNLTLKGEINFYGQGFVCATGYPALEVHEILHLFSIPHNPNTNSVMSPYTEDSSGECKITKIDEEYVSCLKYIYSNGTMGDKCYFPNVIHEKEVEYTNTCDDGWYPVKDTNLCCPEPNMSIDSEGYCS